MKYLTLILLFFYFAVEGQEIKYTSHLESYEQLNKYNKDGQRPNLKSTAISPPDRSVTPNLYTGLYRIQEYPALNGELLLFTLPVFSSQERVYYRPPSNRRGRVNTEYYLFGSPLRRSTVWYSWRP